MADPSVTLFGPVDALIGPYAEYVVLVLAVLNLLTRKVAYDAYISKARDGVDDFGRHPLHVVSTLLLVLASFYYTTLAQHSGIVLSALVLGVVFTDFFEFEARQVEARNDLDVGRPNSSLVASAVMVLYAAYLALFFLVADYVGLII